MTVLNLSNGCAPESDTPLMKNAGVPFAPTALPAALSLSTLSAHVCASRPALNLAASFTPASPAHFTYESGPSADWFLKAVSWNFQKASFPASANTPCAASAAGFAFGWKGSGSFFQMMRTLSGP